MQKKSKSERVCNCLRAQLQWRHRLKEQGKRKRPSLVYNPEEESYHEPYMRDLRKEFSEISMLCDSKVELPWKDIALPTVGMRIRKDSTNRLHGTESQVTQNEGGKPKKKESTGSMPLPWQDLIITGTVEPKGDAVTCSSTLEIPWNDLAFDKPCDIQPREEETCGSDDVEIPWDAIKIPDNVIIECPKKRQHPSSKSAPSSKYGGEKCSDNCGCCAKVATKNRPPMFCL